MTDTLNPKQKEALLEIDRPVLILAGAGSGKTRVITHKIAYLIKEKGYAPWNILAVTFTNKAAREMRERVFSFLGTEHHSGHPYSPQNLWVTTFHSACGRILRREISKIGFKTNFTIYDSDDSKKLVKEIIKINKLPAPSENVYHITSYISRAKNLFESPDQIIQGGIDEDNQFIQQVGQIYKLYEKKLFENNALDFDDLILKTIVLFEKEKETLAYYRDLFRYIMVDEFQDTNHSQYRLIKLLAEGRAQISVVGDDDQSIYSWRGADISNIIDFGNDFKDCHVVKLEQNYRSTNHILNAAHSVVQRNEKRLKKELWSNKGEGEKLKYFGAKDDRSEVERVTAEVINIYETENGFKGIALFYRMNYQSRILEEYLRRESIPYRIFGGIKFYERMEVKDILAYLILMINESDTLAFKRVINVPKRGIGATTLQKIDTIALELGLPFQEAAIYCIDNKMIRNPARDKLMTFFDWLNNFKKDKDKMSVSVLFERLIEEIDYLEYLKQNHDNYDDRLENVKELGRGIIQYEKEQIQPTLDHYLMEIALRSDIDGLNESDDYVSLMTVHNSKGLEFKNVFIVGLGEGIFPHYRSLDTHDGIEEERRLFYVGVTRAKDFCHLSSSGRQMNFGQLKYYKMSRFISEVHPDFIIKEEEIESIDIEEEAEELYESFYSKQKELQKPAKAKTDGKKKVITKANQIALGETLYHKDFGDGQVLKVNSKGEMSTVLLQFPDGNRLLILKYAQLTKPS